jgi:hypothetical protein
MSDDLQPLQFVSNVIELKEGKKYLMIFHETDRWVLDRIEKVLYERGFDCLCLGAYDGNEVQVIEAPANEALTINERRAAVGLSPLEGEADA